MSSLNFGNSHFSGIRSHSNNVALQLPSILTCNELAVIGKSTLNSIQVDGTAVIHMSTTLKSTLSLTDANILNDPIVGNTLTSNHTVTICSFTVTNLPNDGSSSIIFTITNSLITTTSTVLVNITNYISASEETGIPHIYTNVSAGNVGIVLQNINPVAGSILSGNIRFSIIVLGL